jgi:hypothetical protein
MELAATKAVVQGQEMIVSKPAVQVPITHYLPTLRASETIIENKWGGSCDG